MFIRQALIRINISIKPFLVGSLSLMLSLFLITDCFAAPSIIFKLLSIDLPGKYKVDGYDQKTSETVDAGSSFGVEIITSISPESSAAWGLGCEFSIPRERKDIAGDFYFIPLYGLFRFHFKQGGVSPFFMSKLGFNYFDG